MGCQVDKARLLFFLIHTEDLELALRTNEQGDFVRDKVLSYGLVNVVSQATQNTNNYRELIGKTADLFRELKPF